MKLEDHPTFRNFRELKRVGAVGVRRPFGAEELKELARACGARDVGFIGIDRVELDPQRDEILHHYPWHARAEHRREDGPGTCPWNAAVAGHETNDVCTGIVARLLDRGVRAVNPAMGFPMEMNQNPGHAIGSSPINPWRWRRAWAAAGHAG